VSALGLPGTGTIAVLLLKRSGEILATELGGFDDEKAQRLKAALERSIGTSPGAPGRPSARGA
jgi:hypothetical protein